MIEAVVGSQAPALLGSAVPVISPTEVPAHGLSHFERMLSNAEQAEHRIDAVLTQLATGQVGNLHQVMLQMEGAHMQFELFLHMRNKALESWQEVMRMQV
jgi:flagellar hook-basal body complex protein FliE